MITNPKARLGCCPEGSCVDETVSRAPLDAEIERLMAFARWAIHEGSFAGCTLDGGSIQDKAAELGILTKTKYDPAVHGDSDCAEPGDDWFVFASALEQKVEDSK